MVIYNKGINNGTSSDDGNTVLQITSTEEEKKKVRRLVITDVNTNPVILDVWLERERIVENLPLEVANDIAPERVIDLDIEIPVGQTLKFVLKPQTSGNQGCVSGWVEYEIVA